MAESCLIGKYIVNYFQTNCTAIKINYFGVVLGHVIGEYYFVEITVEGKTPFGVLLSINDMRKENTIFFQTKTSALHFINSAMDKSIPKEK